MVRSLRRTALLVTLAGVAGLCGCKRPQASETKTRAETMPQPVAEAAADVREPAVAGAFYPADPDELRSFVQEQLSAAKKVELPGRVVALIVPHAGYVFSGHVAAAAFAQIAGQKFDTVIAVGPSHHMPVDGVALTKASAWRTPLGDVPINTEMCAALQAASERIHVNALAHKYEHSVEVELPLLQEVLKDFELVPLVMTDFSEENCHALAQAIVKVAKGQLAARSAATRREGGSVLLVASSDMSHYPAYDDANRSDKAMLAAIKTFDIAKVRQKDTELMGAGTEELECTMCGLGPVLAVMEAAKALGADQVKIIKHANSGDMPEGDRDRCVGYGAVALCGPEKEVGTVGEAAKPGEDGELNEQQQKQLLALARETITQYLTNRTSPEPPKGDPAFEKMRAVFVTLTEHGDLRGCIGTLEAREPLAKAVISSAISAATQDPRFPPMTANELDDVHIEISVLSPMRKVASADEIVVGKHGVAVEQGLRRGVFLPQVAPEQGWDRDTMLNNLCAHKAGLPEDAWKHGAELYVFTAQVFEEHKD